MRIFLVLLFFFLSLALLSIGFLTVIAPLKEGLGPEYISYYGLISLLFLFILISWIYASKKSKSRLTRGLGFLCILIALFNLIIVMTLLGSIIYRLMRSKSATENVKILQYTEKFIEWPGFSYPVGLNISIELTAPFYSNDVAGFYPPIIWMGPLPEASMDLQQTQEIYFSSRAGIEIQDQMLAILKRPVFSREKQPAILATSNQQRKVSFNLYPGVIEYFEDQNKFCTYAGQAAPRDIYSSQRLPDVTFSGNQLNAIWFYAGHVDVLLSQPLTQVMRQHSQLENNTALWNNMHSQFTDEHLLKIGYKLCSVTERSHCFCK